MRISVEATDYFQVNVEGKFPDGSLVDPTSDAVQFTYLAPGATPDGGETWYAGSWYPGQGAGYFAQWLVGSGGTAVPVGSYVVWVKITDNPTVPVLNVGPLEVY